MLKFESIGLSYKISLQRNDWVGSQPALGWKENLKPNLLYVKQTALFLFSRALFRPMRTTVNCTGLEPICQHNSRQGSVVSSYLQQNKSIDGETKLLMVWRSYKRALEMTTDILTIMFPTEHKQPLQNISTN